MRFHILVTPIPDEPLILTEDRLDAGLAWLEERVADGRFEMCEAFDKTGGFVILSVPTDDRAEAFRMLDEIFADYPLNSTVDKVVDVVLSSLKEGFDVLRAAVRAGRRIETRP